MQKWTAFLESLATRGGNLFILLSFVGGLLGLLVLFLYHPSSQTSDRIVMVVLSTFSGFAGALLNTLVGSATHNVGQNVNALNTGKTPPPAAPAPGG